MDFLFLVLLLCFILLLYIVYELSRDDFVILRKDIHMEKIFNAVFIVSFLSLFISRLVYVISHPSGIFLNPLAFIVFPYYPGLSLAGGILGGVIFSFLVLRAWKMPIGRILDFFSISFVTVFPLGFLLTNLISRQKLFPATYISLVLYVALFLLLIRLILPKSLEDKVREGSLTLTVLVSFSFVYIISNILIYRNFVTLENVLAFVLFISSLLFLAQYEGVEKLIFKR